MSSEKRFVSIHEELHHARSLTLAEYMNYEDGDCGVGSFVWGGFQGVSKKNQEREHIFVLVCFFLYCAHHRSTQLLEFIGGKRLGAQGPYCQIQPSSEWNGALHLFRQNAAIMHSIRRSVLALIVTNHIQKSQWGALHNLTAQTLTLLIIQANTPPLTTVLRRGAEWTGNCTPGICFLSSQPKSTALVLYPDQLAITLCTDI